MSDLTRKSSRLIVILLTFLVIVSIATPLAAAQLKRPHAIYGYVTVDGVPMSGITVSGGDLQTTSISNGYYQLDVYEGMTIQVAVTYDGHTASSDTFTTVGDKTQKDLNIDISGSGQSFTNAQAPMPITTQFPTITPEPSPAATSKTSSGLTQTATTISSTTTTPSGTSAVGSIDWISILIAAFFLIVAGGVLIIFGNIRKKNK